MKVIELVNQMLAHYAREDVELKVIGHVATEEDDNDNRT